MQACRELPTAEAALEDARKRKLESAKARALQEAGDIMDRLTGVLPKLDAVLAEKADIVEETTETPPQTPERETPLATNEPGLPLHNLPVLQYLP